MPHAHNEQLMNQDWYIAVQQDQNDVNIVIIDSDGYEQCLIAYFCHDDGRFHRCSRLPPEITERAGIKLDAKGRIKVKL